MISSIHIPASGPIVLMSPLKIFIPDNIRNWNFDNLSLANELEKRGCKRLEEFVVELPLGTIPSITKILVKAGTASVEMEIYKKYDPIFGQLFKSIGYRSDRLQLRFAINDLDGLKYEIP